MNEPIDQRTAPHAALLLRVTLGCLFIAHLYFKYFIRAGGAAKWWSGFETNDYPWFVPWYRVSAEFLGALLLIPGIYTRWVSSTRCADGWRCPVSAGQKRVFLHGVRR
jgi:putative oxidoreductase